MQNLKATMDLPKIKPIKNKSNDKLCQGMDLHDRNSISDLQNNQFLSRKSLSSMKKSNNVEIYYGNAPLGVPFKWESQPGTPKVKFLETPLPPLTPPPSYVEKKKKKNATKNQTKGKFLQRLFFIPKLNLRKSQLQPSPTSSSSSWSLSSSSFSSPPRCWSYSVPASPCRVKI
ncbi:hypothetical protein RND71_018943 [Anisodus tanguticus]|uniref:Uncharacterized protein n=1 Tax=Anisodus tanguticus TaxID=243964 RepID=A0AAE1S5R3_9SOLA|nr:hypothetical protein RND71_018943 [Anisodus tanguticus]